MALVFSIISGMLGVAVIIWYGLAGDEGAPGAKAAAAAASHTPHPHAARRILEAGLEPPAQGVDPAQHEDILAVPSGGPAVRS